MPENQATISRKVVVVGTRYNAAEETFAPAFYIANIKLTKDDVEHDRLNHMAEQQAISQGGFAAGGYEMTCFPEEEFSVVRAFCQEFQLADREEYAPRPAGAEQITQDYRVRYETTIRTNDPHKAAEETLEILKNPGEAVIFTVQAEDNSTPTIFVDLFEDMDEEDRQTP